jgi:hypothetical protein
MSAPTPTMDAVERAFRSGITSGPPCDPTEPFLQVGILTGQRLLRLLWSGECPVELDFKHTADGKRLAVVGIGRWFPTVCTVEAFIFCVAPLSQVQGAPDFPKYPHSPGNASLAELAEWVREVSVPGGAGSWRAIVEFERKDSK